MARRKKNNREDREDRIDSKEVKRKARVIPLTKARATLPKEKDNSRANNRAGKRVTPWYQAGDKGGISANLCPEGGNQSLFLLAFAGLLVFLFYPPFFRGLFFPTEQRWTLLLAAVLFFLAYLWKLSRREVAFLNRPLDYAATAMVIVYILAAIQPASRGLAVAEVAKVLLYFLTYWLVSRLGSRQRNLYILHALYLAAAGAALAALLAATELVYIKDGFVGGRFYSTLQYPNALASYVGAGSIIGFYLWARAGRRQRYFYAAVNYLLLMVFLGTGSRGAYLVFPLIVGLYWVLTPRGYRFNTLAHLVVSAAAALTGNIRFIPLAVAKAYGPAWSWFALGLLVALAGQLLIQVAAFSLRTPRVRAAAGVATLIILLGGGAFFVQHQLAAVPARGGQPAGILTRILPPQVTARLQDISLETRSGRERLIWTGDALQMVRERPLLGFGGGGWEAAYRQYQSYFYNSTQVHNDYAQVAVETGLAGIAVLGAIWVLFLLRSFSNYRAFQGSERLQALAIGVAALNLGLHAAVDFDLALGAVSMMLWACFGLARNQESIRLGPEATLATAVFKSKQAAWITAAALAALVVSLFSISYLAGVASARQAAAALQRNDLRATASYLEEAGRYDPFTASYNSDLAGIYLRDGKKTEALAQARIAVQKEPYNPAVLSRLAEACWQNGDLDAAIAALERAREAAPWAGSSWENLGQVYTTAGISFLQAGQQEKARHLFQQATDLPVAIQEKVAALGEFKELHQPGGVNLTPAIKLYAGIGDYFLGREEAAANNLNAAAKDAKTKTEAQFWQALLAQRQGDTARAGQLLAEVQKADANLAKQYDQFKALPVLK